MLGAEAAELQRLKRQQQTWSAETTAWVDQLGLEPGATVVDAGCGPGLVVPLMRERVGEGGRVIAIDAEPRYLNELHGTVAREAWQNVEVQHATLESVSVTGADAVFARWVLTFPTDPGAIVKRMADWLKPGGRLVVVDYNHEGISLFPRSEAFVHVIATMRKWFVKSGGDPFVAGRLPGLLRAAGLEVEAVDPIVRCGAPGTPTWCWAEEFLLYHSAVMEEQGLLTSSERDDFVEDWHARRKSPDTRFYTPIQVCLTARKPAG